ncbi:MAG: hypothetical protein OXI87_13720 [Albidovulum sp.]|nr:hypothetical protein [Albidovulum sp.]MDE0531094.1 hypothetical protein [Albidovulum sp.]
MSSGLAGVESPFDEDAFSLGTRGGHHHHAPEGFPVRHPDLAEAMSRLPPKIEFSLLVPLRLFERRAAVLLDLVDQERQQA